MTLNVHTNHSVKTGIKLKSNVRQIATKDGLDMLNPDDKY